MGSKRLEEGPVVVCEGVSDFSSFLSFGAKWAVFERVSRAVKVVDNAGEFGLPTDDVGGRETVL